MVGWAAVDNAIFAMQILLFLLARNWEVAKTADRDRANLC
jgi:hypothetical protein